MTRLTEIQGLWDVTSCRWARIPDISKDRGTLTSRVKTQKSTGTLYLEDGNINLLRNVCNCSPACTPLYPQIFSKLSNVCPYNAVHLYQSPQDNNPFRACCLTLTNYISVDSTTHILKKDASPFIYKDNSTLHVQQPCCFSLTMKITLL
jgi:hypothetical protein